MGNVTFNNIDSNSLDIIIQSPPTYLYPERDVETKHIPGRNGDLVIDNKCFKNVKRTYNMAVIYDPTANPITEYTTIASQVTAWLHSAKSEYVKLEDTYDPDVYRMARYSESSGFTDVCGQALTINVNFECKPQRFLKSGDRPITYTNTNGEITIENPSVYESLPLIEISGIQSDQEKILLMTTIDSDDEVVSTITLASDITKVYIDSDKQTCYTDTEDINYKVGLNGKSFPVLGAGESTITIKNYTQDSERVERYNNVIANNQNVCKAEYKSQDILISEQEEKVFIKSYDSVISSVQKGYVGMSYQAYMMQLAEKGLYASNGDTIAGMYTFQSFNKVLDSLAMQFSVLGNLSDNPGLSGAGNGYIKATQDGDTLKVYNTIKGYFMTSADKLIRLCAVNTLLAEVKTYSSLTVNYYPTTGTPGNEAINASYDDLPDWLDFEVTYSTVDGVKTPQSIAFKAKRAGTYWLDKQWTFGKAKWIYLAANSVLNEMAWSNSKRAFMPKQGISTSTAITYTYRFVDRVIRYGYGTDKETYVHVVRPASPSSGSDDLVTIKLVTNKAGYYSYQLNDNQSTRSNWVSKTANSDLVTINGTDAFEIFYLEDIPVYTDDPSYTADTGESTWPTWLNPEIISVPVGDPLNATRIKFTILEAGWYRYSYKSDDAEMYTSWVQCSANTVIDFNAHPKSSEDSFYISRIDSIPSQYTNDRCYTVNDGQPSSTPPAWITAIYTAPSDELPDGQMQYKANAAGYYKWDTNTAWMTKLQGDDLLTSGAKDTTIIYYMASMPDYPTYNLCEVSHREDSTGNPTEIIVTALADGYYRINYDSDWTYYEADDVIYEATVGEEVRVSYLEPSNDSMSNLIIKITPRWWVL